MAKRDVCVMLGTAVPRVPQQQFSKLKSGIKLDEVWQLIGPTVDRNINSLPLWKVFCIAYLQGLENGAGLAEQMAEKVT